MNDAPVNKFVISICLRRCLNAGIEGAWGRLDDNKFPASTLLRKKDENRALDALGGLRK
jgi:hypothetical protein